MKIWRQIMEKSWNFVGQPQWEPCVRRNLCVCGAHSFHKHWKWVCPWNTFCQNCSHTDSFLDQWCQSNVWFPRNDCPCPLPPSTPLVHKNTTHPHSFKSEQQKESCFTNVRNRSLNRVGRSTLTTFFLHLLVPPNVASSTSESQGSSDVVDATIRELHWGLNTMSMRPIPQSSVCFSVEPLQTDTYVFSSAEKQHAQMQIKYTFW